MAGILATTDSTSVPFIIAIGVVGSLIASLIALFVDVLVVGDTIGRVTKAAATLEKGVERLETATDLLRQAQRNSVRGVKPKADYDPAEWRTLLTGAQQRFFVVGHALDKWCKQGMREPFVDTLRRLAEGGRDVWLVSLPIDGPAQDDPHRGVSYKRRIETTMRVLAEVHAQLPPDGRVSGFESERAIAMRDLRKRGRRHARRLLVVPCEHVPCLGGAPASDAGAALLPPIARSAARMGERHSRLVAPGAVRLPPIARSEGPRFLRLARCWLASTNSRQAGSADG